MQTGEEEDDLITEALGAQKQRRWRSWLGSQTNLCWELLPGVMSSFVLNKASIIVVI